MAGRCPTRRRQGLGRLGRTDRDRIKAALMRLPEGNIKRLTGQQGLWRLRVGDWRAIFERNDAERLITVLDVRPRGRAYSARGKSSPQQSKLVRLAGPYAGDGRHLIGGGAPPGVFDASPCAPASVPIKLAVRAWLSLPDDLDRHLKRELRPFSVSSERPQS